MREKKNIDRLFQEKFKDFESSPDNAVWDKINSSLHDVEDSKKPIPFWFKAAGIAAVLLLSIAVGSYFLNQSDATLENLPQVVEVEDGDKPNSTDSNIEDSEGEEQTVVDNSKEDNKNISRDLNQTDKSTTKDINEDIVVNESISNEDKLTSKDNLTTDSDSRKNPKPDSDETNPLNPSSEPNNTAVAQNSNKSKERNNIKTDQEGSKSSFPLRNEKNGSSNLNSTNAYTTVALPESNELRPMFMINEESSGTNEKENVETMNRWNVAPMISPVYFNTLGQGSSIDSQFNQNSKSGNINFSYGITGSYALNNRLKIRAGINKMDLGYSTNEVIVYRNANATVNGTARLRNIRFKDTEINTSFISATNISYAVIPDAIANNIKGSIDQELGFIEVPIELEYNIINKKVGVNVIGGFSTLFLDRNEVYSSLQNDRRLIGEATNINKTSYSANLGVGFNFKFSETIDLNLEPTFKYQLNTFEDSTGDFQPYFIGVYSGLRFKF